MRILFVGLILSLLAVPASANGPTGPAHLDTSGVNMQPAYPASALGGRESGHVVVRVGLRDDGAVTNLSLLRSSGFDDLDSAAMNAARLWHYVPAMDNGNSEGGSVVVQIVFNPPPDTASN